jgi:hypothetical protein
MEGWRLNFLETVLLGLTDDVPLVMEQRLWFQNDGTAVRYGQDVQ